MSMTIYTGDLKPDLRIVISDTEAAVDLTTATSVRVIGKRGTTKVIDRTPSGLAVEGQTSIVVLEWQAGETTDSGRIDFEVEAIWPAAKPQTYRCGHVDIQNDYDRLTA